MKRLALSLAFLSLAALVLASYVPFQSVQPLQYIGGDGAPRNVCSSFSINEAKGLWATAGHCAVEGVFAPDGDVTWVVIDHKNDLAVYQDAKHAKALLLAFIAPKLGDKVSTLGYPLAATRPVFLVGLVAAEKDSLNGEIEQTIYQLPVNGGNSGSPIMDETGKVVGVLQNGAPGIGGSVPFSVVKDVIGEYFERP